MKRPILIELTRENLGRGGIGLPARAERTPKPIDLVLQRCAWVAQILLLVAAVVGYIVTVRPVHQKQLLDEQIAERTIRLREATEALARLSSEEARIRADNSRLERESREAYRRLRANLGGELYSAANTCTILKRADPADGKALFECVVAHAQSHVMAYLRPDDQAKLKKAIGDRRKEIAELPKTVSLARAATLRKAKSEIARTEAEIKTKEQNFLEVVRKQRKLQRGDEDRIETVKDVKILNDHVETNAYLDYLREVMVLGNRLRRAEFDRIQAESDFGLEQSDSLRKILASIRREAGL